MCAFAAAVAAIAAVFVTTGCSNQNDSVISPEPSSEQARATPVDNVVLASVTANTPDAPSPQSTAPPPVPVAPAALETVRFIAYSPPAYDPRPDSLSLPSRESIVSDLQTIRPWFDGLIIYSSQPPAMDIIECADNERFRGVVLGIWDPLSKEELMACTRLAQAHPNLITAICIGNEGLQFGRYAPDALKQAFDWMRAQVPNVPLTTSEPISQYGSRFLQELPDFHAPNIHPYFDTPLEMSMPDRAAWVIERASALAEVTGKRVLCKETGWPSGGDDRCSPETRRQFWTELRDQAARQPNASVVFAAFEAFDLPWKAEASGLPVEDHWGFFTSSRVPKTALEAFAMLSVSELAHDDV